MQTGTSNILARLNRAVVESTTGRKDPDARHSLDRYKEGYRIFEKFVGPDELASLHQLIASHDHHLSRYREPMVAAAMFALRLALSQEQKIPESLTGQAQELLGSLSTIHTETEASKEQAEEWLGEALRVYASHGRIRDVARMHLCLAELYDDWRERTDWLKLLTTQCEKAEAIFDQIQDTDMWLLSMETHAQAFAEQNELLRKRQAADIYEKLLSRCDTSSPHFVRFNWSYASLCKSLGLNTQAIEAYRRGLQYFSKVGSDFSRNLKKFFRIPFGMLAGELAQLLLSTEPDDAARREALMTVEAVKGRDLMKDNLFLLSSRSTERKLPADLSTLRDQALENLRALYIMRESEPEFWDELGSIWSSVPDELFKVICEGIDDCEDPILKAELEKLCEGLSELRYGNPEDWAVLKKEVFGKFPEMQLSVLSQIVSDIEGEESSLLGVSDAGLPVDVLNMSNWNRIGTLCKTMGSNVAIASYRA